MHPLTALTVVGFAIAAMFVMVTAATETNAARLPLIGHVLVAVPPGMNSIDMPE